MAPLNAGVRGDGYDTAVTWDGGFTRGGELIVGMEGPRSLDGGGCFTW